MLGRLLKDVVGSVDVVETLILRFTQPGARFRAEGGEGEGGNITCRCRVRQETSAEVTHRNTDGAAVGQRKFAHVLVWARACLLPL